MSATRGSERELFVLSHGLNTESVRYDARNGIYGQFKRIFVLCV